MVKYEPTITLGNIGAITSILIAVAGFAIVYNSYIRTAEHRLTTMENRLDAIKDQIQPGVLPNAAIELAIIKQKIESIITRLERIESLQRSSTKKVVP